LIEKPDIPDEKIIRAVQEFFSIRVAGIEFLPLGWDPASSSYRVDGEDRVYFLKVRKGLPNPAGMLIPRHLQAHGFEQVMGPLSTRTGEAWADVEDFHFILYPFIAGRQVWDVGMSDAHWVELGALLKRLHATQLGPEMLSQLPRESFVPPRLEWSKALHERIQSGGHDDPFQEDLAALWREHYSTISTILGRAEELSEEIRGTSPRLVLCHGDVHTANVLITDDDRIFLVDWDDTVLAPRERDLLFLPGNVRPRENELFFQGYGETELDPLTRAYYRYFWCIEDMGGFAEMIFTTEGVGELIKADALSLFRGLFADGSSIDTALRTPIPS
jgi:spectinomycin phosphotransferase